MYLKEISITNYKSFHGEHTFRLHRGANIIAGGSGSGKTNLCGAVEFALFGGISRDPYELSSLVNLKWAEEAEGGHLWAGCEVSLFFEDGACEHRVSRDFSLFDEDQAVEKTYYSSHLSPKISRHVYRDYVYVDEDLSGLKRTGTSARVDAEKAMEYLLGLAELNVARGLGVMLLDNSLSRLPACDREDILKSLIGSGLDQVMWLVHPSAMLSDDNAYRLGETIESVTFKVEGFPFEPSLLRREIESTVRDSYVARGDVYRREVYGHDYTVEAVEVAPNGARYQSGISRLTVT